MPCGWCGERSPGAGTNCATCGGPLLSSGEAALGPAPPPAPRSLPARFLRRELFSKNSGVWVGMIFGTFGGIFPLIFGIISIFNPLLLPAAALCLVFPLPGAIIAGLSWRRAKRRVDLLRAGSSVRGSIESMQPDRTTTINGRHPTRLAWLFEVEGRRHGGALSSVDGDFSGLSVGDPIHIIFDPKDPDRSDVWPVVPR